MRKLDWAIVIVEALVGLNALVAGGLFLADPTGGRMAMTRETLAGTPFDSYLIPGLLLAGVVGGSLLVAAVAHLRRWRWAPRISLVAAGILLIWIVVQLLLIGFGTPIQAVILALALVLLVLAIRAGGATSGRTPT